MATTTTKTETLVGKRIRRREDPRLITGTATYVDDIQMPGMHHACIVRSPHGAAKIKSINIKPALDFPGVAAVFTGKDTEKVGPVPCGASLPGLRVPHHHILAIDRVYFVGTSGGGSRGHGSLHRARRRRRHRSGLRAAARGQPIPKKRSRPARPPCIRNGPTTPPSTITRKAATSTRRSPRPKWS